MSIRTSNPPSYDKIFAIRTGASAAVGSGETIPNHRGLFMVATSSVDVTFTNLDGSTASVRITTTPVLLPVQIKSYTTASTAVYLYGLL